MGVLERAHGEALVERKSDPCESKASEDVPIVATLSSLEAWLEERHWSGRPDVPRFHASRISRSVSLPICAALTAVLTMFWGSHRTSMVPRVAGAMDDDQV